MICLKRSDTVTARAAYTAGTFSSLITAPGQLIRDMKRQPQLDDICFVHADKGRNNLELLSAADIDRTVNGVVKRDAAVRISVSCRVIAVGAVIDFTASL